MYEHKHLMMNRIDFLLGKSKLTDISLLQGWKDISKSALGIRNQVIKIELSNKRYEYKNISECLGTLKETEEKVLAETIGHIRECI